MSGLAQTLMGVQTPAHIVQTTQTMVGVSTPIVKALGGRLLPTGEVDWNEMKMAKRFARAPWERERCMDCELLPLCMGPCSQHMIEVGEENRNKHCWMDTLELTVEDYVINRYNAFKQRQLPQVQEAIVV